MTKPRPTIHPRPAGLRMAARTMAAGGRIPAWPMRETDGALAACGPPGVRAMPAGDAGRAGTIMAGGIAGTTAPRAITDAR